MKKSFILSAATVVLLFAFSSCENFLDGSELKTEIDKKVEYQSQTPMKISIVSDFGTVSPSGVIEKKSSDSFSISYTEGNSGYKFYKWQPEPEDAFEFENLYSNATEVKVLNKKAVRISPVIFARPTIDSAEPANDTQNGKPKNSSIYLTFNKSLSDENDYSRIKIYKGKDKSNDLKSYFQAPVWNENTLVYAPKPGKFIPLESQLEVITIEIPADFYYETEDGAKIDLGNAYSYSYTINNETNSKAEISFITSNGNISVTPKKTQYSIGESFVVDCIADEGYQYSGLSVAVGGDYKVELNGNVYVATNKSDSSDTFELFEYEKLSEDGSSCKFTVITPVQGITVSAVIGKYPSVVDYSPKFSNVGANWDSAISIVFNKEMANSFSLGRNIFIKDSNGLDLTSCYEPLTMDSYNRETNTLVIQPSYEKRLYDKFALKSYYDVNVTISKSVTDIFGTSMAADSVCTYRVNENSEKLPPVIEEVRMAKTQSDVKNSTNLMYLKAPYVEVDGVRNWTYTAERWKFIDGPWTYYNDYVVTADDYELTDVDVPYWEETLDLSPMDYGLTVDYADTDVKCWSTNHTKDSVWLYLKGGDVGSGVKKVVVKETLVQVKGEWSWEDSDIDCGQSDAYTEFTNAAGSVDSKEIVFNHKFLSSQDGLIKLDIYFVDKNDNYSEPKTVFAVRDTVVGDGNIVVIGYVPDATMEDETEGRGYYYRLKNEPAFKKPSYGSRTSYYWDETELSDCDVRFYINPSSIKDDWCRTGMYNEKLDCLVSWSTDKSKLDSSEAHSTGHFAIKSHASTSETLVTIPRNTIDSSQITYVKITVTDSVGNKVEKCTEIPASDVLNYAYLEKDYMTTVLKYSFISKNKEYSNLKENVKYAFFYSFEDDKFKYEYKGEKRRYYKLHSWNNYNSDLTGSLGNLSSGTGLYSGESFYDTGLDRLQLYVIVEKTEDDGSKLFSPVSKLHDVFYYDTSSTIAAPSVSKLLVKADESLTHTVSVGVTSTAGYKSLRAVVNNEDSYVFEPDNNEVSFKISTSNLFSGDSRCDWAFELVAVNNDDSVVKTTVTIKADNSNLHSDSLIKDNIPPNVPSKVSPGYIITENKVPRYTFRLKMDYKGSSLLIAPPVDYESGVQVPGSFNFYYASWNDDWTYRKPNDSELAQMNKQTINFVNSDDFFSIPVKHLVGDYMFCIEAEDRAGNRIVQPLKAELDDSKFYKYSRSSDVHYGWHRKNVMHKYSGDYVLHYDGDTYNWANTSSSLNHAAFEKYNSEEKTWELLSNKDNDSMEAVSLKYSSSDKPLATGPIKLKSADTDCFIRYFIYFEPFNISWPTDYDYNVCGPFYYYTGRASESLHSGSECALDECAVKDVNVLSNGVQIYCDEPALVHTIYSSENLGNEMEKWLSFTYDHQEKGVTQIAGSYSTSPYYYAAPKADIPSGSYYVVIVHFADGTSMMSDVKRR